MTANLEDALAALAEADQEVARLERLLTDARKQRRTAAQEVDAARLALRPTYPTEDQQEAITQIGRLAQDNHTGGTRSWGPVQFDLNYDLLRRPRQVGMHVGGLLPHSAVDYSGPRLWEYTPEEVEAIRHRITKAGFTVIAAWTTAEGHSFVMHAPKESA